MDLFVKNTQEWLNDNFDGMTGYTAIPENGNTGWTTIYALLHAFQITLGITNTAQSSCNANCSNAAHVATWVTATWTANKVSNLCTISTCATGYELKNNACVARNFTLTYDSNGGPACNPATKTITYDSKYGDLCAPSRTGYTFDGWFTAASGGTQITKDSTVSVTSNQTIYAHWTQSTYTITYNANGGSGSMAATTCNYGSNCTLSSNSFTAPTNKSFLGWSTTSNGAEVYLDGAVVRDIGNTTLYAKWANMKCYNSCSNMGTRCFFQGSNPDNYITFNNETWRIVSIETSGEMQIIRNDVLSSSMAFGSSNTIFAPVTPKINNTDYAGSSLSTYLEGTYYNSLSQAAKDMISKRKQKFGFYDSPPDSDKCKMTDSANYKNSGKSMYCYYWELIILIQLIMNYTSLQ